MPQPQSLANSESSESFTTSVAQKKKRTPWTPNEEEILIDLCKEHGNVIKGSSSKKQEEIAVERATKKMHVLHTKQEHSAETNGTIC